MEAYQKLVLELEKPLANSLLQEANHHKRRTQKL
jgi:hypothetical protein